MGADIYVNGHEVACKASGHKVIAEFPDVCLSPPSPPTGPIPVPYPDTSFAKDMKQGSKSVKIKNKEVMLKDKSFYKSSPLGNEAATRSFGANVLSHTITGKTYFVAWSMDVKFEGMNVDRNIDMVTSNHASNPPGVGPLTVSLADRVLFKKADEKWGHKRGRSCGDNHVWDCDTMDCPNCWDPPCVPNAAATKKNYQDTQSGTNKEKAQKAKERKQKQVDKAEAKSRSDKGTKTEIAVIDKIGEDNIERVDYKAHCSVCHMVVDIDIVTSTAIIEVKYSAKALRKPRKLQQLQMSVAAHCPELHGREFLIATKLDKLPDMEQKLRENPWSTMGLRAIDP